MRGRSHKSVGVETERQEECAFSITENHLSWCGVGFDHDAGTYVPCSDRVKPHGMRFGMAKAFLYPRVGYVPKVPHVMPQSVVLQAFSPSPFGEPD